MHGITLSDLHYLVAVADEGSFRRAAERCHISQPTLSGQIKKIEALLGVSLFERGKKQLHLTTVGEQVVSEAWKILQAAEQLMMVVKSHQGPLFGELCVGVIPTLCPYLLPWLMPPLQREYGKLELLIREDLTANLLTALQGFGVDAALLALPVHGPALVSLPLFEEPFWFVCHPKHPLARLAEVTEADLGDAGLILLNEGHCLREQALSVCGSQARHAMMLGSDLRAASLETARQMVAAGMGSTLMPALSLGTGADTPSGLEIRPFRALDAKRRIGLVWRKSFPREDDIRLLAQVIRDHLPAGVTAIPEAGY